MDEFLQEMAINLLEAAVPAIEFVEKAIRTGRKLSALCVQHVRLLVKCPNGQSEETAT